MTCELKSMFESHLDCSTTNEISEKQRIELEERQKKEYIKKQTGMKREILKLVGGIPSVVPIDTSKQLGKLERVNPWVWGKFYNSARTDNFQLSHWQRKEDIDKDYEYAQFNKKINIVKFSEEEYERLISSMDPFWTIDETDHLWDLCERYDLRFTVVHDRYDSQYNRTVEELKDRYYSVAKKILENRKEKDHPILKSGYNYEHEMKRRAYLEKSINRTNEDCLIESEIIKQSEEIENKLEMFSKMENFQKNLTTENRETVNFEEYVKMNANTQDSFVYTRSQKLKFPLPISEKLQKKVDLLIKELQIPEKLIPTTRVEQAYDNLQNNLIILTSLKKHTEKKEKELSVLNQKLNEIQNKVPIISRSISNPVTTNIINNNLSIYENSVISETSKERSKKNISLNKTRKRKAIAEPQLDNTSSSKKRKKLNYSVNKFN